MYKINKSTRFGAPYAGPTCAQSGIEPGKLYTDKKEAEKDAKTLSEFNRVGFQVRLADADDLTKHGIEVFVVNFRSPDEQYNLGAFSSMSLARKCIEEEIASNRNTWPIKATRYAQHEKYYNVDFFMMDRFSTED